MSKLSNLITMMNLLSTGRKYSIRELADILEVTPRMIRTYKEELEKAGIYIDSIMGPYGGYVLNQSIKVPARKFKKEDYELLQKYLFRDVLEEDKEVLQMLKDKIRGVCIDSQRDDNILDLNGDMLTKYNVLVRAMKQRRKVKIRYTSVTEGEMNRIIEPAEIFLFHNGWYCAAYCELRKKMRHFELNKIKEIEIFDEKF